MLHYRALSFMAVIELVECLQLFDERSDVLKVVENRLAL